MTERGASRRGVLRWLWGGLGLAALAELGWIAASFLRPRPAVQDESSVILAGPAESFQPGSVTAFPAGKLYLVRLQDGGFLALSRECTHLGCSVPWKEDEQRFACPCHASSFDITGALLSPPAPRPLDRFPVRIENGLVKVDTATRLRRQSTSASEAVHL